MPEDDSRGDNDRDRRGPGPAPGQSRSRLPEWRHTAFWLLVAIALGWYWAVYTSAEAPQPLTYTEFKAKVRDDAVTGVSFSGDRVSGELKNETSASSNGKQAQSPTHLQFVTTLPPIDDPGLMPLLEQHDVDVRAQSQQMSWWWGLIVSLLPWIAIGALVWFVSRRMRERMSGADGAGGLFGFGKSRAKRFRRREVNVTFDDVAGLRGAKEDLREITGYLKDPAHYRRLGAKIPKGILLMGAPGTGKTLLARAVAGEAQAPFFSISGSEFIEMFVGVGASRVRDLFDSAKRESPAIIFIDEIDSVGRARGAGLGGGHDEREQTLNQILSEMDGFAPHEAVVVLAATNRPDVLDPALLRPGRFDRKVALDLPDRKAREAILRIHAREVQLAEDVDLDRLAALTVGFSGADLENLVNEAALLAGRDDAASVTMALLLRARDRVVLGGKRELALSSAEKQLIACHEAGHALAASLLPQADPLDKVTIIPRGRALGATEQIPEQERHSLRESYLKDRIGVMLGGRISEQIVFGETSSGAEQDLEHATRLARRMVSQWGMSTRLGPVAFRRGEEHIFLGREMAQQRDFSEHTARVVDAEIRDLVGGIEKRVTQLLKAHRHELDMLAAALLEHETLQRQDIESLIASARAPEVRAG